MREMRRKDKEKGKKYIEKHDKATKVIKIEIQHISGKRAPAKS